MWLITCFTFKEALRKKAVLIACILTAIFLILYGTGLHFISKDSPPGASQQIQGTILFTLGIYLSSFLVAALSILAAVGSVAGEIENGTLPTLAVRPLSRTCILLGKFTGMAAMLVIYTIILFLALTGLVYWKVGLTVPGLGTALLIFILEPLVLLAVTLFGSVWLTSLGNGILVFTLYTLSVVGGMMEQVGAMIDNSASIYIGVISSLILPADAVYRRLVDTVINQIKTGISGLEFINPGTFLGPFGSVSTPSNWMLVYTIVYIAGLLYTAVYIFNRRDI